MIIQMLLHLVIYCRSVCAMPSHAFVVCNIVVWSNMAINHCCIFLTAHFRSGITNIVIWSMAQVRTTHCVSFYWYVTAIVLVQNILVSWHKEGYSNLCLHITFKVVFFYISKTLPRSLLSWIRRSLYISSPRTYAGWFFCEILNVNVTVMRDYWSPALAHIHKHRTKIYLLLEWFLKGSLTSRTRWT